MGTTIRDLYRQGLRVRITIKPTIYSRTPPPASSLIIPLELAEILFEPIPSPKKGFVLVANKLTAKEALRRIFFFQGGGLY